MLLHLVDAQDTDVATSYRIVRDELENYGEGLTDKPVVVALNKVDTLDAELIAALSAELAEESGAPVMALSGASGQGIAAVLDALQDAIVGDKDDGTPSVGGEWSPI